jgi:uncharacterized repeat protein (TIGR02543 family)
VTHPISQHNGRSREAALFLIAAVCALASVGHAAIPDNDNFATRIALVGTNVTTTGSNVGATLEPGELDPSFEGGRSVWWSWTAPADGAVTITTAGSNFDTMLAAYTGGTLGNLTLVTFNDDREPTNTSIVTFNVVAGTVCQISVDGSISTAGNIVLHLTLGPTQAPPANDRFANRGLITGSQANVNASNVGATREPAEPFHASALGFNSVWWSWTAPSSGGLTLTTEGSSFDTVVGVYTGSSISNLVFVAANEDDYLPLLNETSALSRVTFNVSAGTTYQIAVDGYEGESGGIRLQLALGSPFPQPANDNFANREVITGTPANVSGSNVGASFEGASADFDQGEPLHVKLGGKSVWWTWTAPSSGGLELTTSRSTFDTVLAVYTGMNLTNLVFVAGADDDPWGGGRQSGITCNVTVGTTYQIVVDGWDGASGEIQLHFRLGNPFAVPPNDNFANRILMTGNATTVSGFNDGATLEPQEGLHNDSYGGKSVWWSWVSPGPGIVTVDTIGSRFDTTLAVYTGSALANLTEIASDDDGAPNYNSTVSFYTKSGVTHQIAVDGYDGAPGNISLSVAFTPASYNLAVTTNPTSAGSVNVNPLPDQNGKFAPGSVVTLTASPAAGYAFSGWTGSLSTSNNPFSLAMNSDKTVTAGFSLGPPGLRAFRNPGFRLLLSSAADSTCVIDYSIDLRNWISLKTNQVMAGQSVEISDPSNDPWRFYRARRVQ